MDQSSVTATGCIWVKFAIPLPHVRIYTGDTCSFLAKTRRPAKLDRHDLHEPHRSVCLSSRYLRHARSVRQSHAGISAGTVQTKEEKRASYSALCVHFISLLNCNFSPQANKRERRHSKRNEKNYLVPEQKKHIACRSFSPSIFVSSSPQMQSLMMERTPPPALSSF